MAPSIGRDTAVTRFGTASTTIGVGIGMTIFRRGPGTITVRIAPVTMAVIADTAAIVETEAIVDMTSLDGARIHGIFGKMGTAMTRLSSSLAPVK